MCRRSNRRRVPHLHRIGAGMGHGNGTYGMRQGWQARQNGAGRRANAKPRYNEFMFKNCKSVRKRTGATRWTQKICKPLGRYLTRVRELLQDSTRPCPPSGDAHRFGQRIDGGGMGNGHGLTFSTLGTKHSRWQPSNGGRKKERRSSRWVGVQTSPNGTRGSGRGEILHRSCHHRSYWSRPLPVSSPREREGEALLHAPGHRKDPPEEPILVASVGYVCSS